MFTSQTFKTWKLSIPIILGELAHISLGLIDSAMVGAIGYKHLAAASLVNSIIIIPFVIGMGITISIAQRVAQANGKNDGFQVSHILYNGIILCAVSAIIIALFLDRLKPILYHLKQDEGVVALAMPYWHIVNISIVPSILFLAIKQFTDGLEKTKIAMLLSLLSLPLNAFLNWLFIFGNWGFPRLALEGAAWGTLITRIFILLLFIVIIFKHTSFKKYLYVRKTQWQLRWTTQKKLLLIGIPAGLQMGLETGAFAITGILVGTIGAIEQAAHHIALQCASFTFMVSWGLSQGCSIRLSNAFSRDNWVDIYAIWKTTLVSGIVYGIFCAIFFVLFKEQLILLFNQNTQVITLGTILLLYSSIFQISDATQAIAVGSLRGINDVKFPTIAMVFAYWIIGIPLGSLLTFYFNLGAKGIWIGLVVGLSMVSLLLNKRMYNLIKNRLS